MTNERLIKVSALLITGAAASILLKNASVHITGILLPFLTAWIASAVTRPAAL